MVSAGSFAPKVIKVLLAEDNAVNQEVISEMLFSIGCRVKVVANGLQAIDALNYESYDMIFMDCQMPIMDGHEAARRIRDIEKEKGMEYIPIIGITGRVVRENYEKSEQAFMDGLLDKPFSIEQLIYTIFLWTGVQLQDKPENRERKQAGSPNHFSSLSDYNYAGINKKPLDIMVLENISKLDSGSNEFLKKIVTIYFRDASNHISEIRAGIEEKNNGKIFRAAHSLKSASANVGAMTLSNMCQELESIADHQITEETICRFSRIEIEYASVVSALNSFMNHFE